jgi:hypothetical protein
LENHVNSCFYSSVSSEDIPPDIITEVMELILKFIR